MTVTLMDNLVLTGALLILAGHTHEMLIYYLQWKHRFYQKIFHNRGFQIHAIQLGGFWIITGLVLLWTILQISDFPFHYSSSLKLAGGLLFLSGLAMMCLSYHTLGWKTVMKSCLFDDQPWEVKTEGIFRWLEHPMYLGSQLAMGGLAFLLDQWIVFVYLLEMMLLQAIQSRLESRQVRWRH